MIKDYINLGILILFYLIYLHYRTGNLKLNTSTIHNSIAPNSKGRNFQNFKQSYQRLK